MGATILVTGSSTGFGRLTVETLARQGHKVFAGIRDISGKNQAVRDELRALAENEQLALDVVELDVTNDPSVDAAVQQIVAAMGRLDVVVNNAGVSYSGPIEAFTVAQAQELFNTNVFGVMRVNRAVLPQMRAQGSGLLLQIGSISGRIGLPFLGLYGATKFTLEGLTESYRYELAPFGIDAAIIEPGTYPTTNIGANRRIPADQDRAALYASTMRRLMPRVYAGADRTSNPQDVADAIAALIALPAGQRPLRTVVAPVAGQREAVAGINQASLEHTRHYYQQIDLLPAITLARN